MPLYDRTLARMSRRELMKIAWMLGAAAVAPPILTRRAFAKPIFDAYPFSLGVASGDPLPDGVVLWTRLAPKPLEGGGMPMTMCRISMVRGLGPALQIAEGYSVDLPAKVNQVLDERTNPSWPTTWFVPTVTGKGAFRDVYTVMNNWSANHGSISYGHVGADLIALASLLRIPVAMHNVAEEKVFRPSSWSLFGALEPQGADYRACENFGPLYG